MARKLGYFLKQRRNQLFMYQEEAAKQIGVSVVHYSHLETNKVYSHDPKTLKAIAEFLEQTPEWVMEMTPKKPKHE